MATVQQPSKLANRYERFVSAEISRAVRRVRFLDLAKAGLGLLIAIMAYGLVMMFADKWLVLSQSARQISLIGFLVFAALYTWFVLLRPIRRAINPYYAAVQVEQMLPDAKNSIVNWLDLHEGNLPPSVTAAIGQRAAQNLEEADLEQAIRSNTLLWLAGIALGLVVGVVGAFMLMRSDQFASLLDRTFSPFSHQAIVKQTRITMLDPVNGDKTLSVGQNRLTIKVQIDGKIPKENQPDSIRLLMRYNPDSPDFELPQALTPDRENRSEWSITLSDKVQNGFWYRVVGGDDETLEYRIRVHSSPMIGRFEVTRVYRPYLRFVPVHDGNPNIEDWRGTEITLDAFTNRNVATARLNWEGTNEFVVGSPVPDHPEAMRFKFVLDHDAKYSISFETTDKEKSNDTRPYSVTAWRDMKPVVRFTKPEQIAEHENEAVKAAKPEQGAQPEAEGDLMIQADGMLHLEGVATDDFGIHKMTLRMKFEGDDLKPQEYLTEQAFRLDTGGWMRSINYKDDLDLTKLQRTSGIAIVPQTGQRLEFWLEAEDTCDYLAPQVGSTRHYFAKILPPKVGKNMDPKEKAAKEDERKKDREIARDEQQKRDAEHEKDRKKQGKEDQNKLDDQKDKEKKQGKNDQGKKDTQPNADKNRENAGDKGQPNPDGAKDAPKDTPDSGEPTKATPNQPDDSQRKKLKDLEEELQKEQQEKTAQQLPPKGTGDDTSPKPDPMKSDSGDGGSKGGGSNSGDPKAGDPKAGDPKAGDPKAGDPKAGDPKAGDPKAGDPKAGDPKAGDPKAGDPKAGDPKAGDPKAGDPKAGDPKAGDPKAGDPKAGDPKAGDPKAGDPKAGDPKAGDPKAGDPKAGDPKAGDPKAGDPKAGDPKAGDPKAGDPKAGDPKAGDPKAGDPKAGDPKAGDPKAGDPKAGDPKAGDPKAGDPKAGDPKAGDPKAGDPKAGDPKAGDPKAGDPKAGDPKAGDPKAGDPKAGDPKAGDPKAGDPKAGDPKAGDPKAGDPKAGDPKAGDPKAGDPKAGDPKAGDPKAGDPKAGDPKAGDPKAGDPKAGDPKAGDPKAGDPKAGDPKAGDPKAGDPKAGDPKAGDPKAGDPKAGDPKAGDPKAGDPKAGDPKAGDPKAGDPKAGDPKAGDPKAGDPKAGDPKAGDPKAGDPKAGDPKAGDPKAGDPKAGDPKAGDPKAGDPKAGDPKAGDPKAGDPKAGDPKAGDPKAGDPKAGDPKAGDPKAGDPKAGDPKAGDPKAGDPKAGDPKAGDPKAGDPKAGDPKAGDPKAGDPKAGDPKAGDPKAGDPKAGDPKAGDPKAGDPKADDPKAGEPKAGESKASDASKVNDEKGKAGNSPGGSVSSADRDRGIGLDPEKRGKIEDPNEAFKKRSGDLDLEKVDKEKLKKLFQKYGITPEEWDRYVKEHAKLKNKPSASPDKNDVQVGSRKDKSFLNDGVHKVEGNTDANPGHLQAGSTGNAPAEYKDAAAKFAELLSQPPKPKEK